MTKKPVQGTVPETTTLYHKVGNKYKPVAEYVDVDFWRTGTYLVVVRPGMKSIKRLVFPRDVAEVEAAFDIMQRGMSKAILDKAATPLIKQQKLTPLQAKAFALWRRAFNTRVVWFPSTHEIVEAGLDELRKYFAEWRK
jgi:hypothetical protein